jgi:hypothetical protein
MGVFALLSLLEMAASSDGCLRDAETRGAGERAQDPERYRHC